MMMSFICLFELKYFTICNLIYLFYTTYLNLNVFHNALNDLLNIEHVFIKKSKTKTLQIVEHTEKEYTLYMHTQQCASKCIKNVVY